MILLFYKSEDLAKGKTNFIKIIEGYLSWQHSIVIPFLVALLYTFAYPYFKDFVKVYLARISLKTDEKLLTVGNIANVPIARFVETKNQLKKQEQDLAALINEEGLIKNENNTLKSQIIEKDTIIKDKAAEHLAYIDHVSKENDKTIAEFRNGYEQRLRNKKTEHDATVKGLENTFKAEVSKVRDDLTTAQVEVGRMAQENDVLNSDKKRHADYVLNIDNQVTDLEKLVKELEKLNASLESNNSILKKEKEDADTINQQLLDSSIRYKNRYEKTTKDGVKVQYLIPDMLNVLGVGDKIYSEKEGWGEIANQTTRSGRVLSLDARFGNKLLEIDSNTVGLYIQK